MSEQDPGSTAAGWYPAADGRQRYWDGTAWTEHYANATEPAAEPTAPADPADPADPVTGTRVQRDQSRSALAASSSTGSARRFSNRQFGLFAAIVAAVLAVTIIVYGVVGGGGSGSKPTASDATSASTSVATTAPNGSNPDAAKGKKRSTKALVTPGPAAGTSPGAIDVIAARACAAILDGPGSLAETIAALNSLTGNVRWGSLRSAALALAYVQSKGSSGDVALEKRSVAAICATIPPQSRTAGGYTLGP